MSKNLTTSPILPKTINTQTKPNLNTKFPKRKFPKQKPKRIFSTNDKRKYTSPTIKDLSSQVKLHSSKIFPVFINEKGVFFDLIYNEIKDDSKFENSITNDLIKNYVPQKLQLPKFPNHQNCKSYQEFEQKAKEWEMQIKNHIGFGKLPKIMGRNYPRPTYLSKLSNSKNTTGLVDKSSDVESHRTSSESRRSGNISTNFSQFNPSESNSLESLIRMKNSENNQEQDFAKFTPDFYEETHLLKQSFQQWKNQLIPSSPESHFYSNFEEYEQAFTNWGKLILTKQDVIPPHPSQFSILYEIKTAKEQEEKKLKKKMLEFAMNQKNAQWLKKKMFHMNRYRKWIQNVMEVFSRHFVTQGYFAVNCLRSQINLPSEDDLKNNLEEKKEKSQEKTLFDQQLLTLTRKVVSNIFEKLVKKNKENTEKYGTSFPPIMGKLPRSPIKNENKKTRNERSRMSLRRNDVKKIVSVNQTVSSRKLHKIFGNTNSERHEEFELEMPQYEPDEIFDLKKMNDPEYRERFKKEVEKIDEQNMIEKYQYCTNLNKYHEFKFEVEKKKVDEKIKGEHELNVDQLKGIFYGSMPFDFFKRLIESQGIYQHFEKLYSSIFLSIISPENFHEILSLLNDSCSFLVHTKVAQFVWEILQTTDGRILIEQYVENKNLTNLYYIAYSINLLTGTQNATFPFSQEISFIIQETNKHHLVNFELVPIFLMHYYLSMIYTKIKSENEGFSFVTTLHEISKKITELEGSIETTVKKSISDLERELFTGIGSRSLAVSEYYSFILENFLNHSNDSILNILQSSDLNLLGNIRQLSQNKFSHVQFASKKFWAALVLRKNWQQFLITKYTKEYFMLITDFMPVEIQGYQELDCKPSTLMSFFVYIFLKKIFKQIQDRSTEKHYLSFLRGKLFFDLLVQIEDLINQQRYSETLIQMSEIMKIMVKKFEIFDTVRTQIPENITEANQINSLLLVNPDHLRILLSIISKSPIFMSKMKINFASILRRLLRHQEIFNYILEDLSILQSVINCFDKRIPCELSEKLWGIIYDLIFYHPNFVEILIKNNLLKDILMIISPGTSNCIIYFGLSSVCKILEMSRIEKQKKKEQKNQKTKKSKEKKKLIRTAKSMEKDTKMIIDLIIRSSFFISCHMIYAASVRNYDRRFLGIVNLYQTISSNPLCSKLFGLVNQKEQYKAGFENIRLITEAKYKVKWNKKKNSFQIIK
ncbi:sca1 complex scaffold protein scaa [Anaeramoeba ignava]|uniref:Sca1 complex scaffold protein scaa n=1 Tax=Anaeramoeba ignava TaxID=1746090 RepID=A0A9Q0LAU6_ANAIG|nr:sca1 complex scaffold protein scaa [Anaeramoeba ignava]